MGGAGQSVKHVEVTRNVFNAQNLSSRFVLDYRCVNFNTLVTV